MRFDKQCFDVILINLMTYKNLSLSSEEKRLIAETLWDSVLLEDESITEEEKQLSKQRGHALQNGETKLLNREESKKRIRPSCRPPAL